MKDNLKCVFIDEETQEVVDNKIYNVIVFVSTSHGFSTLTGGNTYANILAIVMDTEGLLLTTGIDHIKIIYQ